MKKLVNNVETAHNKALHRTAIPLRSIAAGELGRYMEDREYGKASDLR